MPTRKAVVRRQDTIRVVIETPKDSRNKYAFDPEDEVFVLKRVLPVGMAFPYDFGFVPSTIDQDGDPVDVLVLTDEPAVRGRRLKCRLVGVIEGEEIDGKKAIRNDRLVAVGRGNHRYAAVKHIDDLGNAFVRELEAFFANYHALSSKHYRIVEVRGPREARRRLDDLSTPFRRAGSFDSSHTAGLRP